MTFIAARLSQVGDAGLEGTAQSTGNTPACAIGAAQSAAVDPEMAIVIDAWAMLARRTRSIVVGEARKAISKSHPG
jgi:hypothetical protein